MTPLPFNTKVRYNIEGKFSGTAIIVGWANVSASGYTYIIKTDKQSLGEDYPYDTFNCPDCCLTVIKEANV